MSMGFLLQAVRDHLRSSLQFPGGGSVANRYVDVQPGGHPPQSIADHYYGIDEETVLSAPDKTHLKEQFTLSVFITKVATQVAGDRRGSLYLDQQYGLDKLERAVIRAIHGNLLVMHLANTIGGLPSADNGDKFIQPLWYAGRSKTTDMGGEWAGLEPETKQFLVRVLKFTGAIRTQALDVMH